MQELTNPAAKSACNFPLILMLAIQVFFIPCSKENLWFSSHTNADYCSFYVECIVFGELRLNLVEASFQTVC